MRMHIVYDSAGRIIAAAELSEELADAAPEGGPRPVPGPDQSSVELELPPELAHLSFKEACETLEVDVAQKEPRLRTRSSRTT